MIHYHAALIYLLYGSTYKFSALSVVAALQSAGDTKQALVYLGMKRSREQARDRLLQSLVGLTEAMEVCYV
jgi:hypothetical protein